MESKWIKIFLTLLLYHFVHVLALNNYAEASKAKHQTSSKTADNTTIENHSVNKRDDNNVQTKNQPASLAHPNQKTIRSAKTSSIENKSKQKQAAFAAVSITQSKNPTTLKRRPNPSTPKPNLGRITSKSNSRRTTPKPKSDETTVRYGPHSKPVPSEKGASGNFSKEKTATGLKLKPSFKAVGYMERYFRECENPASDVAYFLTKADSLNLGDNGGLMGLQPDRAHFLMYKMTEKYFFMMQTTKWYIMKVGILENNSTQHYYRIYNEHLNAPMVHAGFPQPPTDLEKLLRRVGGQDPSMWEAIMTTNVSLKNRKSLQFDYSFEMRDKHPRRYAQDFNCYIKNRFHKDLLAWKVDTNDFTNPHAYTHGELWHVPDIQKYTKDQAFLDKPNVFPNWILRVARCEPLYQVAYRIVQVDFHIAVNKYVPSYYEKSRVLQLNTGVCDESCGNCESYDKPFFGARSLNDSDKWYLYKDLSENELYPAFRIRSRLTGLELLVDLTSPSKLTTATQGDAFHLIEKLDTIHGASNLTCTMKAVDPEGHNRFDPFVKRTSRFQKEIVLEPIDTDPWLHYNYIIFDYKGYMLAYIINTMKMKMLPFESRQGDFDKFYFSPAANRGDYYLQSKRFNLYIELQVLIENMSQDYRYWLRPRANTTIFRFYLLPYSYDKENCYAMTTIYPATMSRTEFHNKSVVLFPVIQPGLTWETGSSQLNVELNTFNFEPRHCFMLLEVSSRGNFSLEAPPTTIKTTNPYSTLPLEEVMDMPPYDSKMAARLKALFKNTLVTTRMPVLPPTVNATIPLTRPI